MIATETVKILRSRIPYPCLDWNNQLENIVLGISRDIRDIWINVTPSPLGALFLFSRLVWCLGLSRSPGACFGVRVRPGSLVLACNVMDRRQSGWTLWLSFQYNCFMATTRIVKADDKEGVWLVFQLLGKWVAWKVAPVGNPAFSGSTEDSSYK